jgi:diguanylate cyclase (GGDEF)-like protein
VRKADDHASAATILIADDSATARATTRGQLETHGYCVVEAADGAEAIRVCREERPDMVLLDIEMPTLDGHAVLALLREDAELRDTPVVFLSARVKPEDVAQGLRLGAHDYLRKPVDAGELLARVHTALRVKTLQDELRARNDELDRISRTDTLTGLSNRRHLEDRLAEMVSAARRHDRLLGVLVVDIDHFKPINDAHGHAAGDAVLRAVARRLRQIVRAEDAVGRWGGEEFLVLIQDATTGGVGTLAERMRAAVESLTVKLPSGDGTHVTVSIGWCLGGGGADERIDTAEAIIAHADAALHAAKAAGRNRVVSSPSV